MKPPDSSMARECVRLSFAHYNTPQEVLLALAALRKYLD